MDIHILCFPPLQKKSEPKYLLVVVCCTGRQASPSTLACPEAEESRLLPIEEVPFLITLMGDGVENAKHLSHWTALVEEAEHMSARSI